MAALAMTIREARDHLLKRLNWEGVTKWETLALEIMNLSQTVIASAHDWEFLHAVQDITFPDNTGVVNLPADCDRVMALHTDGSEYMVTKIDPQAFVRVTEDESILQPVFYTVRQWYQASTSAPPVIQAEFYSRPSSGGSYELRYIRILDELTSGNLDTVPNIPNHIWDLILRHATLEALKHDKAPNTLVQVESRHVDTYLDLYKKREKYGQTRYPEMRQRGEVANHYVTRTKQ